MTEREKSIIIKALMMMQNWLETRNVFYSAKEVETMDKNIKQNLKLEVKALSDSALEEVMVAKDLIRKLTSI